MWQLTTHNSSYIWSGNVFSKLCIICKLAHSYGIYAIYEGVIAIESVYCLRNALRFKWEFIKTLPCLLWNLWRLPYWYPIFIGPILKEIFTQNCACILTTIWRLPYRYKLLEHYYHPFDFDNFIKTFVDAIRLIYYLGIPQNCACFLITTCRFTYHYHSLIDSFFKKCYCFL